MLTTSRRQEARGSTHSANRKMKEEDQLNLYARYEARLLASALPQQEGAPRRAQAASRLPALHPACHVHTTRRDPGVRHHGLPGQRQDHARGAPAPTPRRRAAGRAHQRGRRGGPGLAAGRRSARARRAGAAPRHAGALLLFTATGGPRAALPRNAPAAPPLPVRQAHGASLAGGCVCCSAAGGLEASLALLRERSANLAAAGGAGIDYLVSPPPSLTKQEVPLSPH